jgi:hypothetical protein
MRVSGSRAKPAQRARVPPGQPSGCQCAVIAADRFGIKISCPPTFSFVIPCFNEEDKFRCSVGSVRAEMAGATITRSSSSMTRARSYLGAPARPRGGRSRHPRYRHPVNLGLGGSYKRGAKAVRDLVVQPNDSGLRVGTRRVFLMVVIALLAAAPGRTRQLAPADAAHSIEVAATNQRHQAP